MNDYNTKTTIPCFHHKCQQTLNEEYITSRISEDQIIFNKYKTFKYNNEIKHNPNKKFCPFPNCESYLLKENTNNFVQCQEGHKYCFNCVNEWHPNSQCDISDKNFKIIEDNHVIKKCPKCNYYIDKDKGCNHIVCYNCQYEWCWICLKEFKSYHYKSGTCIGLMFSSINFIEEKDKQFFDDNKKYAKNYNPFTIHEQKPSLDNESKQVLTELIQSSHCENEQDQTNINKYVNINDKVINSKDCVKIHGKEYSKEYQMDVIAKFVLNNCNVYHDKSRYNNTRLKSKNGKLMITNGLTVNDFQKKYKI